MTRALVTGDLPAELARMLRRAGHSAPDARTTELLRELSQLLGGAAEAADGMDAVARGIERAIRGDGLTVVRQPIVELDGRASVGYEALARFSAQPRRSPDRWFEDAAALGRGCALELAAIDSALALREGLSPGAYLAFNASPSTILSPGFADRLVTQPTLTGLVLEVTEHAPIDDYATFAHALDSHRRRGLRLAIDDTGAGFASLRHILQLRPDVIKLDRTITERIDRDRTTRALAAALTSFALETHMAVIAEGIETEAQLDTMRALGVTFGQGYLLGRPEPWNL